GLTQIKKIATLVEGIVAMPWRPVINPQRILPRGAGCEGLRRCRDSIFGAYGVVAASARLLRNTRPGAADNILINIPPARSAERIMPIGNRRRQFEPIFPGMRRRRTGVVWRPSFFRGGATVRRRSPA